MRHAGAPAGAAAGQGQADPRAGATEGAEGAQGRPLWGCGHHGMWGRRGLCRSCYRKLSEHGCPLPPAGRRWDGRDWLRAWVQSLPKETQAAIAKVLEEA